LVNLQDTECEWKGSGPYGVILPLSRPRRTDVSDDFIELEKAIQDLRLISDNETIDGRIAEVAAIAGLEQLDVAKMLMTKAPMDKLTTSDIRKVYGSERGWTIFDTLRQSWVGLQSSEMEDEDLKQKAVAWNGYRFVSVVWEKGRPAAYINGVKERGRYLLFINKLLYLRGSSYVERAFDLIGKNHVCVVQLDEGVPSCGKTFYIVQNKQPADLAITTSKEGADDMTERGVDCRTIDSMIVNGWTYRQIKTLWIDEGLLAHCGAIEMLIQMVRPELVRVFGDRRQLPFISRINNFTMVHTEYPWNTDPVYHIEAHKNPKVVCDMLRPLYEKGYVWANDVVGSLKTVRITNPENIDRNHDIFLTFTQGEKHLLITLLRQTNVKTIHEVQGRRYERVALVRVKAFDMDIYKSLPHMIVAISRAWRDFAYYTVKPGDMLESWMRKYGKGEPNPLAKREKFQAVPYSTSGGSFTLTLDRPVALEDKEPPEGFADWNRLLTTVTVMKGGDCSIFMMRKVLLLPRRWSKSVPRAHSPETIQVVLDIFFHRADKTLSLVLRMDWPVPWNPGFKLDLGKLFVPNFYPREAIHPILVTTQAERALTTDYDLKIALEKRVLGNPTTKIDYEPNRVTLLVERFMANVDTLKLGVLNLSLDIESFRLRVTKWLITKPRKRAAILGSKPLMVNPLKYFVTPRGDHKVRLDDSHPDGPDSGQLVAAHHVFWTSFFAPFFQGLLIKMMATLRSNIIFHSLMRWDELDGHIDNLLSGRYFTTLELDISKFDKSQEGTMLEAQCRIMKLFGISDLVIDLWRSFHELCKLSAPKFGLSYMVKYQRRSGDALTWLGNTMVLTMIVAYLYPIEKAYMVLLAGDDNLICMPKEVPIRDESRRAAEELNFEIKTLSLSDSMYFSSRFIILTRFGWITAADPVKLICRMGRNDIQGHEHLRAIHRSWSELHYVYLDFEVRNKLNEAVMSRYKWALNITCQSVKVFIDTIAAIINDYDEFVKFYSGTDDEWSLSLDPHERVGGGLYEFKEPIFKMYMV
jgi:hypothetical protein